MSKFWKNFFLVDSDGYKNKYSCKLFCANCSHVHTVYIPKSITVWGYLSIRDNKICPNCLCLTLEHTTIQ